MVKVFSIIILLYFYNKLLFKITNIIYCKKNYGKEERKRKCRCWSCRSVDTCEYSYWYDKPTSDITDFWNNIKNRGINK